MIRLEDQTLRSERLSYRLLVEADKPALRALLRDPAVTRPAGFLPAKSDAEFDDFFAALAQYRTAVGVFLGDTLIGYIHVNRYRPGGEYSGKSCVSTGFVIGAEYQGHGYGTETLRTLTAYLKTMFDDCFADHFEGNEPSRHVILNCGYRFCERYTTHFDALERDMTCLSYVF